MRLLQGLGVLALFGFELWWLTTSESCCVNVSVFWLICLLVLWGVWQMQS